MRPLRIAPGVRVVGVGGTTLGGSGKTPVAIACSMALAEQGLPVVFVGHAVGASPGPPRIVRGDEPVEQVGDEALVASRALRGTQALVVVARTRQDAFDHAVSRGQVLVLDGVLQTTPRRVDVALLAVDPSEPWGARRMPPCGDLVAPPKALLEASDAVVVVDSESHGAWSDRVLKSWGQLRELAVGLLTSMARPDRVLASLQAQGVFPRAVVSAADHRAPGPALSRRAARLANRFCLDVWLATAKCATHWGPVAPAAIPLLVIDHRVVLPHALVAFIVAACRKP